MKKTSISFDSLLGILAESIDFEFGTFEYIPWAEFLLNPRRLRGSDFLMRWSQGEWSESRLVEAVNYTRRYFALPYGPSGTAPSGDVRAYELYFERLAQAGLDSIKRPDLLVFRYSDAERVRRDVKRLGGNAGLPFIREQELAPLLERAVLAVECENSLWRSERMPDFGTELSPQKRLGGKPGLKKTAVVPTVIIKEEDRKRLVDWQQQHRIPIHVWHVFFDRAYGIAIDEAERLIKAGLIQPTTQVFQAPGGATTTKLIYKIYYHYAYELGRAVEEPIAEPRCLEDKNGHILPYVVFKGGRLKLSPAAIRVLDALAV
ncbi:MAG: AccI family restriction endonuclease [candidate division WOR-3 bacterium]